VRSRRNEGARPGNSSGAGRFGWGGITHAAARSGRAQTEIVLVQTSIRGRPWKVTAGLRWPTSHAVAGEPQHHSYDPIPG